MISEINLVIAGVKAVMDTFFQFKSQKTNTVKADLAINKVVCNYDAIAMNISVINRSEVPFSILQMFIQRNDKVFDACRITEITSTNTNQRNISFKFKTDMQSYSFNNQNAEVFSLEPFNIHAYLLQNQAETGWIVFKIDTESLIINKFGIKISGVNEILYANA